MKLHDAQFERGLQHRVRAEVRASKRLRALRPRRFWTRHHQLPPWTFRWLLPLFVLVPLMGRDAQKWAAEPKFALAAFLLAAFHAGQTLAFNRQLAAHPDTPPLWHFTADESLTFRWCWRTWWHRPAWAAYDAACVLTVLDLKVAGPHAGWPAIAALAALHGLLSIGWTTRIWGWFDKTLLAAMFVAFIGCALAEKFTGSIAAMLLSAIEPAALAFPAGWLVRAFAEWKSGSGFAWLAAFACIAAVFAGLHFHFRAAWRKSYQDAWASTADVHEDGDAGEEDDAGFIPAKPAVSPLEINACTEAVHGRAWLDIEQTEPSSAIARRVAASLTPRERLLVEAFSEGVPDYPGTWLRAAHTQIKWWLAVALFHWLDFTTPKVICLVLGLLQTLAILPVGSFLPRLAHPSNGLLPAAALVVAMPVSLREIPIIERKLGWPLLLVALPWCALVGTAVATIIHKSPAGGAIFGAKLALLAIAARPLLRCFARSGSSGCSYLLIAVLLLIVALVGAMAFMAASNPWNLAAIGAVWLPFQLLWLEYLRRWNRVRVDAD